MSLMVITCGDCGARFRLDVALMKEPKGETSPAPEEGSGAGVDLSGDLRPEPAPSPPGEMTVPPSSAPALDPQEAVAGKDTALPQTMPKADVDLPTAPEEAAPAEEIVPTVPEREVFSGGRSYMLNYFIVAGLSILLLAGGTLYYRTAKPGGERLGKLVPAYDIRDVKLSFEKQAASGTLFVVKGKFANVGNVPSPGIRIQATLLGKDNKALAGKAAFAGNLFDETSLRRMDRAGIEGGMAIRFGKENMNKEIPTGKALPFMVVFFDPPVEIGAVVVKAMDAR